MLPLLILCAVLAFLFQFFALCVTQKRWIHISVSALLDLPVLAAILYYVAVRPSGFLFDWADNAVFGLYIAGAILIGCGCAWAADLLRKLR